jgi:hypothetical protein
MPQHFLHIASGHSTTGIIARAGVPGTLSIWADPLHEGPVPRAVTDDALVEARARHLAGESVALEDTQAELRRWREVLDSSPAYDELVLWYEHDLFDQLNLIQVLDRLGARERPNAVSLVSIGSYPGKPAFKGMGELTPEELAPLFDDRRPVTPEQYAVAQAAWNAFRAPDPREVEAFLASDTSALPFLSYALRRYLQEFPSTVNGLSRSEQRLLDLVDRGPAEVREVFPKMHAPETYFYIADGSFWNVATALAAASPPLLGIPATDRSDSLPSGHMAITEAGRDVRRGAADRVRQCGIDCWLGGVHLEGAGPIWRWDPELGRIVHT